MKWTFRIVTLVVAAALVAGAVIVLRPQPLEVDVADVVRATLAQTVVNDGKARVRERYTVSAPVAGTLARIDLHEGDVIEPGAVLARLLPLASPLLDPGSRRMAEQRLGSSLDGFEQAKATVERARIARDQATADLRRDEPLARQGALTGAELDQASASARMRNAELASAEFAAKVTEHEIGQARAALARFAPGTAKSEQFEVTSPVRGQILHVLHQSEGVVAAGTALLEVGDPRALELVADVLSQDAVAIKPGMAARVVHWGGEAALAAKVRRIEPAAFTKLSALGVDEQRVNVVLDLDGAPESWRAIGDGFAVEIEITVWSKRDAVQLPTSAVFRDGTGWAVFSADGGKATRRRVEPGHRGPLATEIAAGLSAGDRVIVHPGSAVRDGMRVSYR